MPEQYRSSVQTSPEKLRPDGNTDTKAALEKLRKEHHFSPLISVLNILFEGKNIDHYTRTIKAGEILFDRGEDKHVYILTAGQLAIQVPSR